MPVCVRKCAVWCGVLTVARLLPQTFTQLPISENVSLADCGKVIPPLPPPSVISKTVPLWSCLASVAGTELLELRLRTRQSGGHGGWAGRAGATE